MTEATRRTVLTGAVAAVGRYGAYAVCDFAGEGRRAAGRQAGARLVSLQGRHARSDRRHRRRQQVPFSDAFVVNKTRDEVNAALAAAYMEKDMMVIPYTPIVVNTGIQARRHRHRHRRSELRAQQRRSRPVPFQPEGRRHRRQGGRHRDHLAFPRRPYQRSARCRQQGGVPECGDHGSGGRDEVLHGRRRDEQATTDA